MDAIILAAGKGSRLHGFWDKPKGLIEINGETLIERSIRLLIESGIEQVIVVTGYKANFYEKVFKDNNRVTLVNNPVYASTQSTYSLMCAENFITSDILILDCDIIYNKDTLSQIINSHDDALLFLTSEINIQDNIYVHTSDRFLQCMSRHISDLQVCSGELFYIFKMTKQYFDEIRSSLPSSLNIDDAMGALCKEFPVYTKHLSDVLWCEIDTKNNTILL